jgi:hypothetical protein
LTNGKISIFQVHIINRVISTCINSPLTSILEHKLAQLDRVELTVNQYVNATINAYSNPLSCDRSAPITHNTPLHSRTLCPWEFVNDIDPNRFPPVLTMAKCTCARCFDNYACKPVFYSIHVLQKHCVNGSNKWVRRRQLISVACTCSRPSYTHVDKKNREWHTLMMDSTLHYNNKPWFINNDNWLIVLSDSDNRLISFIKSW